MQATQKSINRRERLARKQEEMKLSLMSAAWERWRDHFLERRLRPTVRVGRVFWSYGNLTLSQEFDVGQQMEATLLFRAFRHWESKTRVSGIIILVPPGRHSNETVSLYLPFVCARPAPRGRLSSHGLRLSLELV